MLGNTNPANPANPANSTPTCRICDEDIDPRRAELGYKLCLWCGEEAATTERLSWCVVQEYGKGPYQLITKEAAPITLKQTNQKDIRT